MKVLIACEESQTVCKAFRARGHEAYSCDLLPCSGEHPEWHIQADMFTVVNPLNLFFNAQNGDLIEIGNGWDFVGMHPECTRLTVAANKYYGEKYANRFPNIHEQRAEAVNFFLKCAKELERIGKGYIENPIGIMSRLYKKPTQIIQPYQFGHTERKSTCLWIEGLPKLQSTEIVEPDIIVHKSGRTDSRLHYETFKLPKEERRKARSKTFSGIAQAMASQWSVMTPYHITHTKN